MILIRGCWLGMIGIVIGWGCGDGAADLEEGDDAPVDTGGGERADAGDEGDADTDTYAVEELCGPEDSIDVMDGEYRVYNNVWGRSDGVGAQCIAVWDNNFEVTLSEHMAQEVAAYPFVLKGCHFGDCTVDSGMPIQISDIQSVGFDWQVDFTASGWFNTAYESWFSQSGNGGVAAELMIWIHRQGSVSPSGDLAYTVELEGYTWEVYHDFSRWHYIAYVATESIDNVSFDFMAFIDDSIENEGLDPGWYLEAMEAGFELLGDGYGLKSLHYEARVE